MARIQARGKAEVILTAAGVSLLQDRGTAAARYPDTLRIRPTSMGWKVGWYRSDPVNTANIYKPPPWLASLGSRLARLPGQEGWATGDGLWGAQVPLCLENAGCSHSQDQHPKSKVLHTQAVVGKRRDHDTLWHSLAICNLQSAPLPLVLVPSLTPGPSSPQVAGAPARA